VIELKKVYEINTTVGKRYCIGVFDKGELLRGSSPKYYKSRNRAEKILSKMMGD
jgi:hypothetical protein